MTTNFISSEFLSLLNARSIVIGYSPLSDEPDYRTAPLPVHVIHPSFMIPPDRNVDPFGTAHMLLDMHKNSSVCIFVPGQKFDAFGNRHGRGGGWYDRFLSRVPHDWLRIGVGYQENFSSERIETKSWDQKVDWMLTVDKTKIWSVHKALDPRL